MWSVIPGLTCERKRISRRTSSFTSTRSRGKETQALSEALSWFQPRSPTESERHPWGLGWAPTKQPREQGGQMRNGSFQGEGPGQPTGQSKSQALRAPAGNKGALRAGDPAASPRDPEDSPWQGAAPGPQGSERLPGGCCPNSCTWPGLEMAALQMSQGLEVRSSWIVCVQLKPDDSVLIRETQRGTRDIGAAHLAKTRPEPGAMRPQAQDAENPQKLEEAKGALPEPRGPGVLPSVCSQTYDSGTGR